MLSRDEILKADDLKRVSISVPEWGGEVYLRIMAGHERDAFETEFVANGKTDKNFTNVRARLCARCLCDETGARLFSDADITALGQKSGAALDRVFAAAKKLNGIGAADIEELVKN